MARPTKQGIDYFPIDCQFDDKTEMYIIEKGAIGLAVLLTTWQMVYSNEGYYILNNIDLHLLIKRKIDVGINEVSDCINVCLRRNLFDNSLHDRYGVLTSKAIQKRFFDAAKKKKQVQYTDQFLLIGVNSIKNLVNVGINEVNVYGNATNVKEEEEEEVLKTMSKKNKFSDDDLETSNYIFSKILKLNPNAKKPNLESWANQIRLMRETDKRSDQDIREVFGWANQDNFWQSNILSPKKLRDKFDQLLIKMESFKNNPYVGMSVVERVDAKNKVDWSGFDDPKLSEDFNFIEGSKNE